MVDHTVQNAKLEGQGSPPGGWFTSLVMSLLGLVALVAAVGGIGGWLVTEPANAVQQIIASIWLVSGMLGLVALAVVLGVTYVVKALR